jgi:hypothetical protein
MYEQLVGRSHYEGVDHIGDLHIGKVVALLGEAANVLAESFTRFLPAVVKLPGVTWVHVRALEVVEEHATEVTPGVDAARWQVLDPNVHAVGEVEGEVLDDEKLILGSPCQAHHAIVLQPDARVSVPRVLGEVRRQSELRRE